MDRFKNSIIKSVTISVLFAFLIVSIIPSSARALSTDIDNFHIQIESQRNADMERLERMISSEAVSKKLEVMGLTPAEIEARLAQLSDAELHQFAMQVENIYSGELGVGTVMILVILLLVSFFVYLKYTDRSLYAD